MGRTKQGPPRLIPACAGSTRTRGAPGTPQWAHPRMRGEHGAEHEHPERGGAHPRMRGEHSRRLLRWRHHRGSSPHARGALIGEAHELHNTRLIPACAGSTSLLTSSPTWPRAHPRMRGEHPPSTPPSWSKPGSSPHARGALIVVTRSTFPPRLIPACAGSTRSRPSTHGLPRAHPRMRGEHSPGAPTAPRSPGSSPHARGAQWAGTSDATAVRLIPACAGSTRPRRTSKPTPGAHPRMRGEHPVGSVVGLLTVGLIPACAGSTEAGCPWCGSRGAHPRMRGEHYYSVKPAHKDTGSSPHARGARLYPRQVRLGCGLIPACAGSTGSLPCSRGHRRAHPRMRGEHNWPTAPATDSAGSSPHARGAPPEVRAETGARGLIPACAGSTQRLLVRCCRSRAHPRMRGEHYMKTGGFRNGGGSSPHARGAHPEPRAAHQQHGLIPECAGSTSRVGTGRVRTGAHPRMRGEHRKLWEGREELVGSSPHARGARRRGGLIDHLTRLIPACAGSTSDRWPASSRAGAHPRMRGEHMAMDVRSGSSTGSSPHARGAPYSKWSWCAPQGLIPACAGSTREDRRHGSQSQGSSPHARGARRYRRCGPVHGGLIPACAGSTPTRTPYQ